MLRVAPSLGNGATHAEKGHRDAMAFDC